MNMPQPLVRFRSYGIFDKGYGIHLFIWYRITFLWFFNGNNIITLSNWKELRNMDDTISGKVDAVDNDNPSKASFDGGDQLQSQP